jgi:hypothetical protein
MVIENFNLDINIINDNKILNIESRIDINNLINKFKKMFIDSINYGIRNNKSDLDKINNATNEINVSGKSNGLVISNVNQNININKNNQINFNINDLKLKIINDISININLTLNNIFNNVKSNLNKYIDTSLVTTIKSINYIHNNYDISYEQMTDYFSLKININFLLNNDINNYLNKNYNTLFNFTLPYNINKDFEKIINFDIIGKVINKLNYNNVNNISNINQTIVINNIINDLFNNTIDDNIMISFINGYKQNINFIIDKINNQDDKIKFYLNSLISLVIIDNYIEPPPPIVPEKEENNNYILISIISIFLLLLLVCIIYFIYKGNKNN